MCTKVLWVSNMRNKPSYTIIPADHPMIDWTDSDFFVQKILLEIQSLEEIGGPDTLAHYSTILEVVKVDIEIRLEMAKERMKQGDE